MKKLACFILSVAFLNSYVFADSNLFLFTEESKGNLQMLQAGKKRYCITENAIYLIEKKDFKKTLFSFISNDAVVFQGNILLATNEGIQLFDTKENTFSRILPEKINGIINHIQTDANNHIWFTKKFEGCYMINDSNAVMQKIKVPVTYSLTYTKDRTIWVGTNVGLYKVPISGKEIERYAEEGIASNELPDNLVEQIFSDTRSNIWAIMPGHITFIASDNESEFSDYEFLGSKNNELYHITDLPDIRNAYLFSTSQGILLMRGFKNSNDIHIGEIHQTVTEKAVLLRDAIIQKPESLKNEPVKLIKDCGSDTYFITNKGLWSINTAKLIRNLKSEK